MCSSEPRARCVAVTEPTLDALLECLGEALEAVPASDCFGLFGHARLGGSVILEINESGSRGTFLPQAARGAVSASRSRVAVKAGGGSHAGPHDESIGVGHAGGCVASEREDSQGILQGQGVRRGAAVVVV